MADNEGGIVHIPVDQLQSNPLQPRGVITPESLVDLVDSIRQHGVLEPLVVAKTPAGYQIIAGERRWRAAKIVGMATIPAVIKETSPRGMLEMALVENVQRIDLNPIERAKAFQRLIDEFNLSTSEISRRIGKSQAYVSNTIRLMTMPDAIKDGILTGLITEGHARALAAIGDNRLMVEAYKIVLRESASVRRAEDLSRRMKKLQGITGRQKVSRIVDESIDKLKDGIEQALIALDGQPKRTKVKVTRSRVETRVIIILKGSLEETEGKLQKVYQGICK